MPTRPAADSRRRGAVGRCLLTATATAAILLTSGCSDPAPEPTATVATQHEKNLAATYVNAFDAGGRAMDIVEAAGAWDVIDGPRTFNQFTGLRGDPYKMTRLTSTDGVFWWCIHDTANDVYAAAATGPAADPSQATFTVGFGPGKGCRYDSSAPVALALDADGAYPLDTDGNLVTEVAAQVDDLRTTLAEQTTAEAVVSYAVEDLENAIEDLGPAKLPTHVDVADLARHGVTLPAGVLVHDMLLTEDEFSFCITHSRSGAWAAASGDPHDASSVVVERGKKLADSCVVRDRATTG